jgi:hypothetical protein
MIPASSASESAGVAASPQAVNEHKKIRTVATIRRFIASPSTTNYTIPPLPAEVLYDRTSDVTLGRWTSIQGTRNGNRCDSPHRPGSSRWEWRTRASRKPVANRELRSKVMEGKAFEIDGEIDS